MTIYEQLCVTKLFFIAMGMIAQDSITQTEMDIACEALKRAADQRCDWSYQQKTIYRFLVDCAKERTKQ